MKLWYHICFFIVLLNSVLLVGCGEDELTKISDDQLKVFAEDFFRTLAYRNFEEAELLVDNESKTSIRKLGKHEFDFNSIYFEEIDTCIVSGDTAHCLCIYEDFDGIKGEQNIELRKYKDEWKVHFILDRNFDNIFLYDYSAEKATSFVDRLKEKISEESKSNFDVIFQRIKSNKLVHGFSGYDELMNLDPTIEINYGSTHMSYIEGAQLDFESTYKLVDNELDEYNVVIDNATSVDMDFYYKSIVDYMVSEFGEPFNLKEEEAKNYYQYNAIRWFVKNYNAILVLYYRPGSLKIEMEPCI